MRLHRHGASDSLHTVTGKKEKILKIRLTLKEESVIYATSS